MTTPNPLFLRPWSARLAVLASLALATLTAAATTPPQTPQISYFAVAPDTSLLLDVDSSGFASHDAGKTWKRRAGTSSLLLETATGYQRRGKRPGAIDRRRELIVAPGPSIKVGNKDYACNQSQLYTSSDRGVNWTTSGQLPHDCYALTGRAGMLYAATGHGLLRSRAGSADWQLVSAFGEKAVNGLLLDNDGRLFATLEGEGGCSLSFVSDKEGAGWDKVALPPSPACRESYRLVGAHHGLLFASRNGNMVSSRNRGATWSRPHKGMHVASGLITRFMDIDHAVDGGGGVSYAYSKFELLKQSRPGDRWQRISLKKLGIE